MFIYLGFRGSSAGKESACNAEDPGLNPGSGRSAGEGIGYLCQYSWASLVAQLGKESACNVRELVSIPGSGRSPGEENSHPLQYPSLKNSTDSIVHEVTKSFTSSSPFNLLLTHSERGWPVCREHPEKPEPPTVTTEMPLFGQLSSLPGRASHLQVQCGSVI